MVQNKDVPPEAIIRQLVKERNKLQLEIRDLKMQIKRKEWAIEEFKKWQAKVAQYKWEYWLTEGVKLMNEPPDESVRKTLNGLLGANRIFDEWQRKVERAYQSYNKAQKRFEDKMN